MKTIATIALAVLLLTASTSSQNKPKDVQGWEETRWGMTSEEIGKTLGSRARKLANIEGYGNGYYEYLVPGINLQGLSFTALLVMDYNTMKLSRVDLRLDEYKSEKPREDVFGALESMLTALYGPPDTKKDERRSDQWTMARDWRFQTTTIELGLYWHSDDHSGNVGIYYSPSAHAKPSQMTPNKSLDASRDSMFRMKLL
jgi:hypothetical protein